MNSTVTEIVRKNPANPDFQSQLFPSSDEQPHFTAIAACGGGKGGDTAYRDNSAPTLENGNRYLNILGGITPYNMYGGGYYSVANAIELVTKAYFNVSILRNAINLLQDFSISPIHVKSANKTVKTFFENWFRAINVYDLMSQYFLEYYRSGNVFLYKFEGKIKNDKFDELNTVFSAKNQAAAKSQVIPIRYIILDPQQVYLQVGLIPGNYVFSRMLSTYEIARLRNPQTAEDKMVFKSFPKEVQTQITQGAGAMYIYAPLDPNRLYYAFYRKQDYEPLAVPMAFPVLNDIEYKLELKRMDQALARTMEHVLLLVTAGEEAHEYSPQGYNPQILSRLAAMFKNQTIGRVLVADYTTKVDWKIPDLKELLGKAKYEAVDQDIKEGLQYMFFGEEKFANASIKAKIFVEGLKEGRRVFLENFLMLEVRKVCEAMNFKNVPILEFEDINIQDNSVRDRLFYQMAQIGLLTPDELNTALETGVLPDEMQSLEDQKQYKEQRDEGLYFPLVGGTPLLDDEGQAVTPAGGGAVPVPTVGGKPQNGSGRPKGPGAKMPGKKPGPIGTKKASFSQKQIVENVKLMVGLEEEVAAALKKRYKVKDDLSEAQKQVATIMTKAIVVNEPQDQWSESVAAYLKEPKDMPADVAAHLDDLVIEFNVDPWEAIVLWKSQIEE